MRLKDKRHISLADGEGQVFKELADAILDAFDNIAIDFGSVCVRFGERISDYFGLNTLPKQAVDRFIGVRNSEWKIDRLVEVAIEIKPTNVILLSFAIRHGISKQPNTNSDLYHGSSALQEMVDPIRGFTNPLDLIMSMSQIVNATCQISVAGRVNGTGLLVGKNSVLTNYHVVKRTINGDAGFEPDKINLKFDFQTPANGGPVTSGTSFGVVKNVGWLIDSSPYDEQDKIPRLRNDAIVLERDPEKLDYALLRVDGNPAETMLGDHPRGFVPIPKVGPDYAEAFQDDSGLFIFQHPSVDGAVLPLRVDWNRPAKIATDVGGRRFVYEVNTKPGSSGSACFDLNMKFIGIHHAGGGPNEGPGESTYQHNQGIPIDKIRMLLEKRGIWELI